MKKLFSFLSITFFISFLANNSFAQQTVQGKVSDQSGNALVGVNVLEKGTKHGTTTNTDGQYSLSVSSSNAILVFSMVGFKK